MADSTVRSTNGLCQQLRLIIKLNPIDGQTRSYSFIRLTG